jgi:hypothetical protein
MKDIIVLDTANGDEIDFSVRERYYGRFFAQSWNKDEQWALLERLRMEGGMIMADVESRKDTALRELMEPFLDEEGRLERVGRMLVKTKGHGEFGVFLYTDRLSLREQVCLQFKQSVKYLIVP